MLWKENYSGLLYDVCLFVAQQPPVGQGLLIPEVSRSHTMTHHSDQLVAEISTWQHTTLMTNIHAPRWDSNPQSQQASGRRPTPQTARPLEPGFIWWTVPKWRTEIGMSILLLDAKN